MMWQSILAGGLVVLAFAWMIRQGWRMFGAASAGKSGGCGNCPKSSAAAVKGPGGGPLGQVPGGRQLVDMPPAPARPAERTGP